MSVYRVSRRYAEAALELGEEQKLGERLANDLELVGKAIRESCEFLALLKSPVIPKKEANDPGRGFPIPGEQPDAELSEPDP